MEGLEIRFKKLFPDTGEKTVIIPVDQGQYFGPVTGVEDLPALVNKLGKADAIIIAPGTLSCCKNIFYKKDSPLQITRLNYVSGYCFTWNYSKPITKKIFDVELALKLGADWVLASLCIGTGDEETDLNNIEIFTEIVKKKMEWGIPLMGEFYPVNAKSLSMEELHKITYTGCRIMYELGADVIKTNYTGEKFGEIINTIPVPVVVLGGEKKNSDIESLKAIKVAMDAGSRGVVVGRNLVQSCDPKKYLEALIEVVKNNMEPEKAIKKVS
jgi:fructose-bisphosphate aldolase, class I